MLFPSYRPRRIRKTKNIREIIQETDLSVSDFIYPMFIIPGNRVKEEITSMPGIFRHSIDNAIKEIKEIKELGIQAVLLFGIPEKKDEYGSEGYNENGIIQRALRRIKEEIKDILLITDVCMCEYTSHGHCGIIKAAKEEFDYPIAAYSVSGEYSMVKAAGRLGWVDETKLMMEILTSIKRAGADIIITYFAKDAASILNPSKR